MWTVLSLIATGVDSILDPARFSVLPLRADELARGLLAAACTGIPAVMLSGLALAQVGSWLGHPAAVPAALVAAVLGVLTAILLSRAVTSALARVMTTRVGRVLGAAGRLGRHADAARDEPPAHHRARSAPTCTVFDATRSAVVASWTPFGWAWALPFDVATGRWWAAGGAPRPGRGLHRRCCGWCGCGCSAAPSPRRSPAPGGQRIGRGPAAAERCSAPRRRPRSRPGGCGPGTATAGWSASPCAPSCCRCSSSCRRCSPTPRGWPASGSSRWPCSPG